MTGNLDALKAKYKLNEESESYLQQRLEKTGKLLDTGACVEEARQAHEEVTLKYAGDAEFEGDVKEFFVPSPAVSGEDLRVWFDSYLEWIMQTAGVWHCWL